MIGNQPQQKTDSFLTQIKLPTYINGIINTKRITPGQDEISKHTLLKNNPKLIQVLTQYAKKQNFGINIWILMTI